MTTPNPPPPTQREGDKGNFVVDIQAVLNRNGFNVGATDGIFGPKTKQGVIAFQTSRGLTPDGIVGPLTWAALGEAIRPPVEPTPEPTTGGATLTASYDSYPSGPGQGTGSITVNGNTYQFKSGTRSTFSVPRGLYRVTAHLNDRHDNPGFVIDGVGFSFKIEDPLRPDQDKMFDPRANRDRTFLRIHPDGGLNGTIGCIGLQGDGAMMRRFRDDLNAELCRHGASLKLNVQ